MPTMKIFVLRCSYDNLANSYAWVFTKTMIHYAYFSQSFQNFFISLLPQFFYEDAYIYVGASFQFGNIAAVIIKRCFMLLHEFYANSINLVYITATSPSKEINMKAYQWQVVS